jgi:hypothetical protein
MKILVIGGTGYVGLGLLLFQFKNFSIRGDH